MVEYHLSPSGQRKLLLVAGGLAILPALFLSLGIAVRDAALLATGGLTGCIMAPFVGLLVYHARYPRMKVDANGLTLRGVLGPRPVHIPWDAIERLRLAPGSEALVLHAPLQVPAARGLSDWSGLRVQGAPMYDDEQQQLIAEQRLVPFQGFAEWLGKGDLLSHFRQHAPRIAEQYEADQPAALRQQAEGRRGVWIILLISAALSVPAVLLGAFHSQLPVGMREFLHRAGDWLDVLFRGLLLLVLPLTAFLNLRSAWQLLGKGRLGAALLWTVMAALQLLLALAVLGSLLPVPD